MIETNPTLKIFLAKDIQKGFKVSLSISCSKCKFYSQRFGSKSSLPCVFMKSSKLITIKLNSNSKWFLVDEGWASYLCSELSDIDLVSFVFKVFLET